jgi:hypothetical protein
MDTEKKYCCLALIIMVICSASMFSCSREYIQTEKNKKIAAKIIKDTIEGKNIEAFAEKYIDPEIEIECPQNFKLPGLGTNRAKGFKIIAPAIREWQKKTRNKVDLIDVVGDNDSVAVLADINRVFLSNGQPRAYKSHLFAYMLNFRNGKVVKVYVVFDSLDEAELYRE